MCAVSVAFRSKTTKYHLHIIMLLHLEKMCLKHSTRILTTQTNSQTKMTSSTVRCFLTTHFLNFFLSDPKVFCALCRNQTVLSLRCSVLFNEI